MFYDKFVDLLIRLSGVWEYWIEYGLYAIFNDFIEKLNRFTLIFRIENFRFHSFEWWWCWQCINHQQKCLFYCSWLLSSHLCALWIIIYYFEIWNSTSNLNFVNSIYFIQWRIPISYIPHQNPWHIQMDLFTILEFHLFLKLIYSCVCLLFIFCCYFIKTISSSFYQFQYKI